MCTLGSYMRCTIGCYTLEGNMWRRNDVEYNELMPYFNGERHAWRDWSIHAKSIMSRTDLDKVMLGQESQPADTADGIAIAIWKAKNCTE